MTVSEIKELAREMGYGVVGVRRDNHKYTVGEECKVSHEWSADEEIGEWREDLGLWEGEELSGTCALLPDYINLLDEYIGENAYIIAGEEYEVGNDEGEIIIPNAVVICEL